MTEVNEFDILQAPKPQTNTQGSWRSAFEGTHPAPFTLANGSVISVAMMLMQTDSTELLFLDGCYCAVRLPFKVPSLFRPGLFCGLQAMDHGPGIAVSFCLLKMTASA